MDSYLWVADFTVRLKRKRKHNSMRHYVESHLAKEENCSNQDRRESEVSIKMKKRPQSPVIRDSMMGTHRRKIQEYPPWNGNVRVRVWTLWFCRSVTAIEKHRMVICSLQQALLRAWGCYQETIRALWGPPGRVKTWRLCLLDHVVGKLKNEVRFPYKAGEEDPERKSGLEESGGDKAPKLQPVPTS